MKSHFVLSFTISVAQCHFSWKKIVGEKKQASHKKIHYKNCLNKFYFSHFICIRIDNQRNLHLKTRMHSSRMRTGRTLTVFQKLEHPPPGPDPPKFGADTPPKIWSRHPPPVNRITHACENITLAKTSFRPVTRFYSGQKTLIQQRLFL